MQLLQMQWQMQMQGLTWPPLLPLDTGTSTLSSALPQMQGSISLGPVNELGYHFQTLEWPPLLPLDTGTSTLLSTQPRMQGTNTLGPVNELERHYSSSDSEIEGLEIEKEEEELNRLRGKLAEDLLDRTVWTQPQYEPQYLSTGAGTLQELQTFLENHVPCMRDPGSSWHHVGTGTGDNVHIV
jgi:hypothetical protein